MTKIDDSIQTPPGYWFGVIEGRLHERMREALADLGLRRGSWRILHTLADGPATPDELAERLPHGGRRDRRENAGGRGFAHGHGYHPGWRGQEPRDERPAGASPDDGDERRHHGDRHHDEHAHHGEHEHHEHQHHEHNGLPNAFERGYERGFDRGFAFGAVRAGHPFGPYAPHAGGPFPGGYPFPGPARGFGGPWGHHHHPFDRDGRAERRGAHRARRVLAEFVERGWVWFDGDRATLTDEGRAAHDEAFARVQAVRAELANGISEQDYATTMSTLETMARNLGWQQGRPAGSQDGAPSMDA
ncbi:MarR family winged helix-turn-helix transcriptional regulator [Leifsonia sp. 21MFCrub1.1]|uniref:MarR family winged helix-turn-helix transcriptional regulator n=1 Tax=Leifsonia sp. 21MFCrub1.1 TaxID=1798223 RepID=UPI0008928982|nr:MarR family winged helix-turn-helix transcriptional regulator [Leifsonia sp. 21MFCrub1.1]SEA40857.1 hypothetical protein SAMN04515680_0257 [Leifsonia sp. 21MFCrub1.1]